MAFWSALLQSRVVLRIGRTLQAEPFDQMITSLADAFGFSIAIDLIYRTFLTTQTLHLVVDCSGRTLTALPTD